MYSNEDLERFPSNVKIDIETLPYPIIGTGKVP